MSYTGKEIFDRAITVLDELSENGSVDVNKTKEYYNRAPMLLDMWQHEVIRNGSTQKPFEISCYRKQNLLVDVSQYGMAIEFLGTDQAYEANQAAYCFFFGVDAAATVYIEELIGASWTPVNGFYVTDGVTPTAFLGTINATSNTQSFKYYKGVLNPTDPAHPIRLRFSGTYYYRHTNRALSIYKYPTADKVPDFLPWYKVTMPDDFKSCTQIINEYPNWQYEQDTYRKWENGKELYINFAYEGVIRVNYIPIPVKITNLTQTLEIDEIEAISGVYYLAEHFAMADQNDELAKRCKQKYAELKAESLQKTALSPQQIVDVYSIGSIK